MKSYIAKIETLEAVQSKNYSSLNDGYNVTGSTYEVIPENQPVDEELTRVTFIMWTEGFSETQISGILAALKS